MIRQWLMGLAAIATMLLGSAPAQAQWMRAESANFIVYGEGNQERLRQRVVLLEDFDRLLRGLTNMRTAPSPNKLHVYLVTGNHALRQVRDLGANAAGFYSAGPNGIAMVVDTSADLDEVGGQNQILLHEYAHHFMMQYFPSAAFPAWYVEGFAEYVMTARFAPDQIEIGRHSAGRARSLVDRATWLPFEDILFREPGRMSGYESARFYAQSWLLVHYLYRNDTRRPQLVAYLNALARNEDPRQAFQAAFGTDPRGMEREIIRYIANDITYTRIRRNSAASPVPVAITPIDANDALIQAHATLRLGVGERYRAAMLDRVRRAAAGQTGPFARRVLAHAEVVYGDAANGERLLTALLAEMPNDAELLYLMGMRHRRMALEDRANRAQHFRAARDWFGRAHRADGNHFPTLFRFAESMQTERGYVSENTSNVLLLAHNLAPQVHSITLQAARMLIQRQQFDDAVALLTPLLANPHAPASVAAAKSLLDRARARSAEGMPGSDQPENEASESNAHLPSPATTR